AAVQHPRDCPPLRGPAPFPLRLSSDLHFRSSHLRLRGRAVRIRQSEKKCRSTAGFGFYMNAAAVTLDNTLADREPDAGAGDCLSVKPLEGHEDLLAVFRLDSDSVVLHGELHAGTFPGHGNVDNGRPAPAILDGVADEVLEKRDEMRLVRLQRR